MASSNTPQPDIIANLNTNVDDYVAKCNEIPSAVTNALGGIVRDLETFMASDAYTKIERNKQALNAATAELAAAKTYLAGLLDDQTLATQSITELLDQLNNVTNDKNVANIKTQLLEKTTESARLNQEIQRLTQQIQQITDNITAASTQLGNFPEGVFNAINNKITELTQGITTATSGGGRRRKGRRVTKKLKGGYIYRRHSKKLSASIRKSKKRPTSK